jgi:hypothetical protein
MVSASGTTSRKETRTEAARRTGRRQEKLLWVTIKGRDFSFIAMPKEVRSPRWARLPSHPLSPPVPDSEKTYGNSARTTSCRNTCGVPGTGRACVRIRSYNGDPGKGLSLPQSRWRRINGERPGECHSFANDPNHPGPRASECRVSNTLGSSTQCEARSRTVSSFGGRSTSSSPVPSSTFSGVRSPTFNKNSPLSPSHANPLRQEPQNGPIPAPSRNRHEKMRQRLR